MRKAKIIKDLQLIPQNHKEFIKLVADGINQTEAYKTTIGNKNTTTANATSQGSKLAKRYIDEIAKERELKGKSEESLNALINEVKNQTKAVIAKMNIISEARRMEILSDIAEGKIKAKKLFYVRGKFKEREEETSIADRIKAVAEMNKVEGIYKPQKIAQTDTEGNDIPLFIQMVKKGVKIRYNEN